MPAASEASAEHAVEARGLLPSDILSDGPPQPGPRRRAAPSVRQPPAVPPGRATAFVAGPRAPRYRAPHKVSVSAVSAILGTILASFWRPRRKAGRAGARAQCGRSAGALPQSAQHLPRCLIIVLSFRGGIRAASYPGHTLSAFIASSVAPLPLSHLHLALTHSSFCGC